MRGEGDERALRHGVWLSGRDAPARAGPVERYRQDRPEGRKANGHGRSAGGHRGLPTSRLRMPRHMAVAALALCLGILTPAPGLATGLSVPQTLGTMAAVTPAEGAPGTMVRVSGMAAAGSARAIQAALCWETCAAGGVRERVPLLWQGRRWIVSAQVPAFTWSRQDRPRLLASGRIPLLVHCLTGQGVACTGPPHAVADFTLTAPVAALRWSALPATKLPWSPAIPSAWFPGFALGIGHPLRVGRCATSAVSGAPRLLVSANLGHSWTRIALPREELGDGPSGVIGCRALAIDPVSTDTYYVAGTADPGTANPIFAAPLPLYTTDNGHTWQPVPVPLGFDAYRGWVGFSVARAGVVAWFSRAFFGQGLQAAMFAEEVALKGGADWVPIPLVCPEHAPCLWRMAGLNPALNGGPSLVGLVQSSDRGRTWQWAHFGGMTLSGGSIALSGSAVLWSGAQAWPAGLAGIAGDAFPVPLLWSGDGGADWQWVQLPAPPPGWAAGGPRPLDTNLRVLPDGTLLLQVWGGKPAGWLLPPGGAGWCALPGAVPGNGAFLVLGRELVWLDARGVVQAASATTLHCAH